MNGHILSSDGTRIAIRTFGPPDAPVVVLVHGLGLSTKSWGIVPELLASKHHVVAYDLRGHGRSDRAAAGDYAMPAHAADLRAVLDHALADGEDAAVVGHSFGGAVILVYAREEPRHRMGGVVFAGSGGSAVTLPGFPVRRMPQWADAWLRKRWLQILRVGVRVGRWLRPVEALSNRAVRQLAFTAGSPREVVEQVRDDFLTTWPEALARTTLASVGGDWMALAPRLHVPTLVLHGDRDPEVPQGQVEQLMKLLPDGELVTLEGAGHMLPLTHGHIVAEQVAGWAQRVGLGRE